MMRTNRASTIRQICIYANCLAATVIELLKRIKAAVTASTTVTGLRIRVDLTFEIAFDCYLVANEAARRSPEHPANKPKQPINDQQRRKAPETKSIAA